METNIIRPAEFFETEENQNPPSLIEVFNFNRDWDLIKPHLHKPEVERALERGMNAYRRMRADLCAGEKSVWDEPYEPSYGPLSCDSTTYWGDRCDELCEEAIERGEMKLKLGHVEDEDEVEVIEAKMDEWSELSRQFYPRPDTLEWYQLHHAGHYLAPWLKQLGMCVFPELNWKLMTGDVHSLAYGTDATGNIKSLFDILHFEEDWGSATDIIELATRRRIGPPKNWVEEKTSRPDFSFAE